MMPPTVFHRNFWIFTFVLTVAGLMSVPRMPDLIRFQAPCNQPQQPNWYQPASRPRVPIPTVVRPATP